MKSDLLSKRALNFEFLSKLQFNSVRSIKKTADECEDSNKVKSFQQSFRGLSSKSFENLQFNSNPGRLLFTQIIGEIVHRRVFYD